MAVEVYIPKFGQTVEEVKLLQWLAEDGAAVKKGQEILEIETDKTTFFVEAEGAGTLHRGPYQVDQTIPVLTVVAIIGAKDEAFKAEAEVEAEAEAKVEVKAEPEVASTLALTSTSRVAVSPRARKLAEEKGIDLATAGIVPTGGEGVRIAERDVLAYLASAPKATPVAQKLAAEAGVDLRVRDRHRPGRQDHEGGCGAGDCPKLRRRCTCRLTATKRRSSFQSFERSSFQPPTSPNASRSRACAPSSPTGWGRASTRRPA